MSGEHQKDSGFSMLQWFDGNNNQQSPPRGPMTSSSSNFNDNGGTNDHDDETSSAFNNVTIGTQKHDETADVTEHIKTFAGNTSEGFKTYLSVNGETRCGLLVDPGAARGLIGKRTLKHIIETTLKPLGIAKKIRW